MTNTARLQFRAPRAARVTPYVTAQPTFKEARFIPKAAHALLRINIQNFFRLEYNSR